MTATNTPTQTVAHQWPWRRSEILSIAVCAAATAATLIIRPAHWWWVAAALAAATAFLFYVGRTRKAISRVSVTIEGSILRVDSDSALGKSRVDLAGVTNITARDFGSDRTLILTGGGTSARIPLRVAIRPSITAALKDVAATRPAISPEGQELLDRAFTGAPVL